jgi:AAA family ATP:ADP antiporter
VLVSLLVFFVLAQRGVPIGLPFFVWIGVVNVFLVAQFWSYANDLYTEHQGRRLFALIAVGGSLGGVVGPPLASLAASHGLLLVAAALLVPCVLLFNVIDRLALHTPAAPASARRPIDGPGGFRLLFADRYLGLVAGLVFVAAVVKTIGEFVLSDAVAAHAHAVAPDDAEQRTELIEHFYSGFFFWVNLVSFAVQAFVVSRVIERWGVRKALFVLPIIALGGYAAIAAVGGIAVVRIAKIAENSTDYSLENTVRQALFLPTARAAKYKAKAAIDTFGVRTGDTVAALTIWAALHFFGLHGRGLAVVNIGLVAVWLVIAAAVVRRHRALTRAAKSGGTK